MSNERKQESKLEKKPYFKPEVKQVQLRPEEAVLGNCKATGYTGPGGGNCSTCPIGCSSCGS